MPEDDEAAVLDDYGTSARLLAPHADYLVVNVSSPNTPGLRSLQAVERLRPLLEHVRRVADGATPAGRVPLLVKIAPDLADDDVVAVADLALGVGLDGIVATNTTICRDGLRSHPGQVAEVGAGGLSGQPLAGRATEVVRLLRARVGPDLTLVGVGGISTADDVRERLAAGADLAAGLHGVRLRGAAVAPPDREGDRVSFGDYQIELYLGALGGNLPPHPFTYARARGRRARGAAARAAHLRRRRQRGPRPPSAATWRPSSAGRWSRGCSTRTPSATCRSSCSASAWPARC